MISTSRLVLRPITDGDKEFFRRYLADEELSKYLPLQRPYSGKESSKWFLDRIEHWHRYQFGIFTVCTKDSSECLGYCGLEYVRDTDFIDIRFGLLKKYWRHGFAYEAAFAVLAYGSRELGLKKVYGAAVPENISSIKLISKLGMSSDAEFCVYGKNIAHYSVSI